MSRTIMAGLLSSMLSLASCNKLPDMAGPVITGTLAYQTPITFAQPATVQLRLTDVSISDSAAVQVATTTLNKVSALPLQYSLPYAVAQINPKHRYTVDARVLSQGKLRFATDTPFDVFTQNLVDGHGAYRDIHLISVGANDSHADSSTSTATPSSTGISVFHNELRSDTTLSVYNAGFAQGHVVWLEEQRHNGNVQAVHARYEYKGAFITHYSDNSPLEIKFDERGRPVEVLKAQQHVPLSEQTELINAVRNRGALLRSHALASSEARAHRQATGG